MAHPPCGLYRTTKPLGEVPAGRLVYFHNHGEPGAGIYTPHRWVANRAEWHTGGHPVPDEAWSNSLEPLPAEGLYRVTQPFFCCDKECVRIEPDALVQLGYTGEAEPLIFTPEWSAQGLDLPERGTRVDVERLDSLAPLKLPRSQRAADPGGLLH
jgi:hypothetical protein